MDNIYYVYQLRVENEDQPFYVGKGKEQRAWSHIKESKRNKGNLHKINKILKAQRENLKIEVEFLKLDLIESDALMWEAFYIAHYGRADLGYGPLTNLTDGGDGLSGYIISEEQREYRRKRYSGSGNPMFGRSGTLSPTYGKSNKHALGSRRSEEQKERYRAARANQIITDETKQKISKTLTGHKHTDQSKSKMRDYHNNKTVYCDHCSSHHTQNIHTRFHGERCRHNPINIPPEYVVCEVCGKQQTYGNYRKRHGSKCTYSK